MYFHHMQPAEKYAVRMSFPTQMTVWDCGGKGHFVLLPHIASHGKET
jgi:hypothetical protein